MVVCIPPYGASPPAMEFGGVTGVELVMGCVEDDVSWVAAGTGDDVGATTDGEEDADGGDDATARTNAAGREDVGTRPTKGCDDDE